MFGLKNIKKFIIGSDDSKEKGIGAKLHQKVDVFSNFIHKKIQDAIVEYGIIRDKLKDLRQTNYNLGLKHLEKGNIKEAVFRFRMVKKFWPNYHDAYYQLAYALILSGNTNQAREVITQLIEKDQSYQSKVSELLESIERIEKQSEEEYLESNNT